MAEYIIDSNVIVAGKLFQRRIIPYEVADVYGTDPVLIEGNLMFM